MSRTVRRALRRWRKPERHGLTQGIPIAGTKSLQSYKGPGLNAPPDCPVNETRLCRSARSALAEDALVSGLPLPTHSGRFRRGWTGFKSGAARSLDRSEKQTSETASQVPRLVEQLWRAVMRRLGSAPASRGRASPRFRPGPRATADEARSRKPSPYRRPPGARLMEHLAEVRPILGLPSRRSALQVPP